jgi:hypothetical protein
VTPPPLSTTTSIKPAAIVLAIATATLVLFTGVGLITNPRVATTTTTPIFVVGALAADPASPALSACELPGNPPSDITSSLTVPVDTVARGAALWKGKGAGGFDCTQRVRTLHGAVDVLAFYKAHFVARGWKLFSEGPSYKSAAQQLLFQKAGSDTFYWIAGITVDESTASSTTYTIRLYQGPGLI